jgi:hypothetical protein
MPSTSSLGVPLMGFLAFIALNVVEISCWEDLHGYQRINHIGPHRSCKPHTVKSHKCIKNPLYIVFGALLKVVHYFHGITFVMLY